MKDSVKFGLIVILLFVMVYVVFLKDNNNNAEKGILQDKIVQLESTLLDREIIIKSLSREKDSLMQLQPTIKAQINAKQRLINTNNTRYIDDNTHILGLIAAYLDTTTRADD
jgi:hypothetical protein